MRDDIIDTNKPSSGRMYDYYLGGNHNFEVDRQLGDKAIKLFPFILKYARLQRWALQDIAEEFTMRRGFDVIIDFASGLPTVDHLHSRVPKGTTVIYSDYDPAVVEYGKEILKDASDVYFFENDCTRPEELFARPELNQILAGRRKVGLCYWGVSGFLLDEEVSHAMQVLYGWADPGSCLAFNAQMAGIDSTNPAISELFRLYKDFGQDGNPRSFEQYTKLMLPWKIDKMGWISLLDWYGFDQSELSNEDAEAWGPMGGGYGAYMTK
jgi:hypothetical protein